MRDWDWVENQRQACAYVYRHGWVDVPINWHLAILKCVTLDIWQLHTEAPPG